MSGRRRKWYDDNDSEVSLEESDAESGEDEGHRRDKKRQVKMEIGAAAAGENAGAKKFTATGMLAELGQIFSGISSESGNGRFVICGQLLGAPLNVISLKNGPVIKFPLDDDAENLTEKLKSFSIAKRNETGFEMNVQIPSWELNPRYFKIENPDWRAFVNGALVAKIQKELGIRSTFSVHPYQLIVCKAGAPFPLQKDKEQEDRLFATLLIQLPSKFTGGQLIVKHDGRTETLSFSSEVSELNQFKTFYSVFYSYCDFQILPLKSGIRALLLYKLVLTGDSMEFIPRAPTVASSVAKFSTFMDQWRMFKDIQREPPTEKLVYVLSHRYSARNLRIDNLMEGDKGVALVLQSLAKNCRLTAMLGMLEISEYCDRFTFNSESIVRSFWIQNLRVFVPEEGSVHCSTPESKFDCEPKEIFPLSRVKKLKPYRKKIGNEITKLYHHAVIVIFRNETILDILNKNDKGGGKDLAEEMFLSKYERAFANPADETLMHELKTWSEFIKDCNIPSSRVDRVFEAVLSLFPRNKDLLSIFLRNYRKSIRHYIIKMVPHLMTLVQLHGWEYFVKQIAQILKNMRDKKKSLEAISSFANCYMSEVRKASFHALLELILEPTTTEDPKSPKVHPLQRKRTYYSSNNSQLSTFSSSSKQQLKIPPEIDLYDFCFLAKKIGFDYSEYASSKPFNIAVPCLLKLVDKSKDIQDEVWMKTAKRFLPILVEVSNRRLFEVDWKVREDFISCSNKDCEDCTALNIFMRSEQTTLKLKLIEKRRLHLQQRMRLMPNITHVVDNTGKPYSIIITKHPDTQPKHMEDLQKNRNAKELLEKLKSIIDSSEVIQMLM